MNVYTQYLCSMIVRRNYKTSKPPTKAKANSNNNTAEYKKVA